jgi:uridine kinase
MVVKHIQRALATKSSEHVATLRKLNQGHEADDPLSPNIKVLRETNQLKGMHTILHDSDTSREDFVFYFDRVSTLLIEKSMDHLEHDSKEVVTPQGIVYRGSKLAGAGKVLKYIIISQVYMSLPKPR